MIENKDGTYTLEEGAWKWSEGELYHFLRKLGRFNCVSKDDFDILLDHLGVEITTTPEKREVVKKDNTLSGGE